MLQEIGEEIFGDIINQKEDHLDKSELIKQTLKERLGPPLC